LKLITFRFNRNFSEIIGTLTPDINKEHDSTIIDKEDDLLEIDVKPTREELIAKYQAAIEEKDRLQTQNNQFHSKIADFIRKRKSEENQNQPLFDKSTQEQEQRYMKHLLNLEQLKKQLEQEEDAYENEIDDLRDQCGYKKAIVSEERMNFIALKKATLMKSQSSRSGRAPALKDVEALLTREANKDLDVVDVRLENIKLENQVKKRENELKAKEKLGEGLHVIDFEQLKIENQTYNEKIEERNEDLVKLKKKINNTVQILTHVKEKLKFVSAANEKESLRLSAIDEEVKQVIRIRFLNF
jgi:hypothetical protein